jgi:hypothetical protein
MIPLVDNASLVCHKEKMFFVCAALLLPRDQRAVHGIVHVANGSEATVVMLQLPMFSSQGVYHCKWAESGVTGGIPCYKIACGRLWCH